MVQRKMFKGCQKGTNSNSKRKAPELKVKMDSRKEERQRDLIFFGGITQELQISKTEFLEVENWGSAREEENLPREEEEHVRVEARSPPGTSSISNNNTQPDILHQPLQPGSPGQICEKVVLYENFEDDFLGEEPRPDLESPEKQSEITLNTTSDSLIEATEEDGTPPTKEEPAFQDIHSLKTQLELTEGLLEAKRAELEQQELKHNEDIKLYKKRLEAKECEITLLQNMEEEKKKSQIKKKEEEWKSEMKKKEDEWKFQANAKDDQILGLRSQLEKEKREKKEAAEKLAAIHQILRPQGSVLDKEGEYVEKFSQGESTSAGLKRESEDPDEEEGAQKKSR